MFLNIAMRFKDKFYKLIAVGLAVEYGFQVFLTIGGVTKFIPLTGVTLPLVSYGGTSIVVTLCLFAIIQGLYISRIDVNIPAHNIAKVISSDEEQINTSVKVIKNEKTKVLPDEEDIMFERAVEEGIKLAQDNPEEYRLENLDDFE